MLRIGIFNSSLQTSANDKLQELKAQNAEIDKQHGMKTDFNKNYV